MFEKGSSSKYSYMNNDPIVDEGIHVLLVHRDPDVWGETLKVLGSCSVRVTDAVCAEQALRLLGARRNDFHLLLMDAHLPDSIDPFTTLGLAVAMKLPTVFSSKTYDPELATRALRNGALNFLVHPLSEEIVLYCLLHPVLQKEMNVGKNINQNYENIGSTWRPREIISFEDMNGSEMLTNPRNYIKKSAQEFKWTNEMRQKFWGAVNHLDDGSCLPRKILDHMNVPGLTRWHVSSYLQKCRNESKQLLAASQQESAAGDSATKRRKMSSYGAKPIMPKDAMNIRSDNVNRDTIHLYPQQASPASLHFIANQITGNNVAGHVGSEATFSLSQAPESSSAGKRGAPIKFYNFLSLKEKDPEENQ